MNATLDERVPTGWWKRRLTMSIDSHGHGPVKRIEYVPGGTPYFWIGDRNGNYYASVNAEDLLEFVGRAHRDGGA